MSYRDARTGEWVTEEFAKANPDTTVYVAGPKLVEAENEPTGLHGMEEGATLVGITHSCQDKNCHVAGFVATIKQEHPELA